MLVVTLAGRTTQTVNSAGISSERRGLQIFRHLMVWIKTRHKQQRVFTLCFSFWSKVKVLSMWQIPVVNIVQTVLTRRTDNDTHKKKRNDALKTQQFHPPIVNTSLIRWQIIIVVPGITTRPHLQEIKSWMSGGIYFPGFMSLAKHFVSCLPQKAFYDSLFYY